MTQADLSACLPPYTPWLSRGFGRFLTRYFARNFASVRVLKGSEPNISGPFIACCNHPSWWDPILLLLIANRYFPERMCYGPIDTTALERYPLLGRLGLLPLDGKSPASIRRFLMMSDVVMERGDAIGITVQGEFVDVRSRPLKLEPGIAYLMQRHPGVPIVPIALEYPFWNEKSPEALVHFGEPMMGFAGRRTSSLRDLTVEVASRLTQTMDELAASAVCRDGNLFETVVDGTSGVGGFYDLGRRIRSWSKGEAFDPSHKAAGHARDTE